MWAKWHVRDAEGDLVMMTGSVSVIMWPGAEAG
jgi:hypothetical protein